MMQKLDIQVYHECMGMHEHAYPQILVPLQEAMTIFIGETVYHVTTQELIQKELSQNPQSKSIRYLYSYLYGKLIENCAAPSIRYIAEHYDLPITVNQLAEIENYNATYYSDWFKQQTGVSPSMYLRSIRISRAKELLEDTNYTVMDIAVMVGYSSNSTFTRAFHSIVGMTPKEYRDRMGMSDAG